MYVCSIPAVTLDTVAKNRLYSIMRGKLMKKIKGVVAGKIQKATSNFILIVRKIYQFFRN